MMSATATAPWQFYDWDRDIELMEGVVVNVGRFLKEEGINIK